MKAFFDAVIQWDEGQELFIARCEAIVEKTNAMNGYIIRPLDGQRVFVSDIIVQELEEYGTIRKMRKGRYEDHA